MATLGADEESRWLHTFSWAESLARRSPASLTIPSFTKTQPPGSKQATSLSSPRPSLSSVLRDKRCEEKEKQ